MFKSPQEKLSQYVQICNKPLNSSFIVFAAAMPHLSIDSVVAASAIVNSLQHLVSRVTNPVQGAVISVTRFNTGAN